MSEKLISTEILTFKEATRHVWNTYYSHLDDQTLISKGFSRYEQIEKSLLWAIVAAPLNLQINVDDYRKHPLECIELKIKNSYKECPIKFGSKAKNGNVTWNNDVLFPSNSSYVFLLFDFFDWTPYGFIDQNYIRFWIKSLPDSPSDEQWGLVETQYAEFYYKSK